MHTLTPFWILQFVGSAQAAEPNRTREDARHACATTRGWVESAACKTDGEATEAAAGAVQQWQGCGAGRVEEHSSCGEERGYCTCSGVCVCVCVFVCVCVCWIEKVFPFLLHNPLQLPQENLRVKYEHELQDRIAKVRIESGKKNKSKYNKNKMPTIILHSFVFFILTHTHRQLFFFF